MTEIDLLIPIKFIIILVSPLNFVVTQDPDQQTELSDCDPDYFRFTANDCLLNCGHLTNCMVEGATLKCYELNQYHKCNMIAQRNCVTCIKSYSGKCTSLEKCQHKCKTVDIYGTVEEGECSLVNVYQTTYKNLTSTVDTFCYVCSIIDGGNKCDTVPIISLVVLFLFLLP